MVSLLVRTSTSLTGLTLSARGISTSAIGLSVSVKSQSRMVRLSIGWKSSNDDCRSSSLSTFHNKVRPFDWFRFVIFTCIWRVWLKTGLLLFMISFVIPVQLLFLDVIVAWRKKHDKRQNNISSPEPSHQGLEAKELGQFWAGSAEWVFRSKNLVHVPPYSSR